MRGISALAGLSFLLLLSGCGKQDDDLAVVDTTLPNGTQPVYAAPPDETLMGNDITPVDASNYAADETLMGNDVTVVDPYPPSSEPSPTPLSEQNDASNTTEM